MPPAPVDRTWLLTWTTYGTWLPGDARGSKIRVRDGRGARATELVPGGTRNANALRDAARARLKQDPIRLTSKQAEVAADAIQEEAERRGWTAFAIAVMANHAHVTVGVAGDPAGGSLLHALKSHASRVLNMEWRRPAAGTWWTQGGSTRVLRSEPAVIAAVRYVRDQEYPLVVRLDTRMWGGAV